MRFRSSARTRSPTRSSTASRRCWMDAREALRRYLEQRRDQGERELVLDSMTVEEALSLLGAPASRAPEKPVSRPPAPRRAEPSEAPTSADWRDVVRAAG